MSNETRTRQRYLGFEPSQPMLDEVNALAERFGTKKSVVLRRALRIGLNATAKLEKSLSNAKKGEE